MFQSTHSRGVRPTVAFPVDHTPLGFQSTHSRGVRLSKILFRVGIRVSIHALTRSATNPKETQPLYYVGFQSTHSRGVRPITVHQFHLGVFVSIHALTRSATASMHHDSCTYSCFNPRTHEECDGLMLQLYTK